MGSRAEEEFDDNAVDEMDGYFAVELMLRDDDGTEIYATATIGDFVTGRELNQRGNFSLVRNAPVTLCRRSNADLVDQLNAAGFSAIPNGWEVVLQDHADSYVTANSTADEVAFTFDIQQGVS